MKISENYPGIWLESTLDSVLFARLFPEHRYAARNMVELFLRNQYPNGQFPFCVMDRPDPEDPSRPLVCNTQIQEVIPFGPMALEVYKYDHDPDFLARLYDAFTRWDQWHCAHRMTSGRGLIEMFCGYDTGMDGSGRLHGLSCPEKYYGHDATVLPEDDVVPILAPDMNMVFWANRIALSKIAALLGKAEEAAAWQEKADEI